jgi:uncharacterized protein YuzE
MDITYDQKYNIAYIRLRKKAKGDLDTVKVSDEVYIDISPDGKIYGIELLNAKDQLPLMRGSQFVFKNESSGKSIKVPVPA